MSEKLRIVPFVPEHLEAIGDPVHESPSTKLMCKDPIYGKLLALGGPGYTGFIGNKAVGSAGITILLGGHRGSLWAYLGKEAKGHGLSVTRILRRGLKHEMERLKLFRVQAEVRKDDRVALEFAERFGMKQEGPLEAFGIDGSDYIRLALINRQWIEANENSN